jgi:hypothetical protein
VEDPVAGGLSHGGDARHQLDRSAVGWLRIPVRDHRRELNLIRKQSADRLIVESNYQQLSIVEVSAGNLPNQDHRFASLMNSSLSVPNRPGKKPSHSFRPYLSRIITARDAESVNAGTTGIEHFACQTARAVEIANPKIFFCKRSPVGYESSDDYDSSLAAKRKFGLCMRLAPLRASRERSRGSTYSPLSTYLFLLLFDGDSIQNWCL